MADSRTPRKWPYRAAKPLRTHRVIRTRDGAPRGVRRDEAPEPRIRITRLQARVAFAAAVLALLSWSAWWAYHSPWLTVQHVTISGASQVAPEQVRSAASVDNHSIFGLDLKAAQARVAALPKVRNASVRKAGRNGIAINVEERTAWGSWQMDGVNVPIDLDGYVLDGPPAPAGSPVIQEVQPQRKLNPGDRIDPGTVQLAARLVRESDASFGRSVLALVYRQTAGLTAVLSGSDVDDHPLWVTFGDSRDYDYKVAALYMLIEQAREQELALNAVDLRFGDRLSFN
ncbi:MAG: FtsQ-type POTRA domain-containing protein [Chloroflexota bacterium]|nr:FtsQ-type POTRA domain-containing protein [Chloroflexota bacterium]